MKIESESRHASGTRFSISCDNVELARAYLYVMSNDLHDEPFGLLEDVYVNDNHRGEGLGKALVSEVISEAKKSGCYKLIATSRSARLRVHELYENLGFENYGLEFRMNIERD